MKNYLYLLCVLVLMLFDVSTGIVQALKNHNFTSKRMREGAFNKAGLIFLLVFGLILDWTAKYIQLGLPVKISIAFSAYIGLMEISSVIENISRINKQLVPEKIRNMLGGVFK